MFKAKKIETYNRVEKEAIYPPNGFERKENDR